MKTSGNFYKRIIVQKRSTSDRIVNKLKGLQKTTFKK